MRPSPFVLHRDKPKHQPQTQVSLGDPVDSKALRKDESVSACANALKAFSSRIKFSLKQTPSGNALLAGLWLLASESAAKEPGNFRALANTAQD